MFPFAATPSLHIAITQPSLCNKQFSVDVAQVFDQHLRSRSSSNVQDHIKDTSLFIHSIKLVKSSTSAMSVVFHPSSADRSPTRSVHYVEMNPTSSLECLLRRCAHWNFDVFLLNRLSDGHPIMALGCKLFKWYDFASVFHFDWVAIFKCLRLIESGYYNNPYHTAVHAADVAQALHCFIQTFDLSHAYSHLDLFIVLIAAFGHDVYHPGVNSQFLENSNHYLYQIYQNFLSGDDNGEMLLQKRESRIACLQMLLKCADVSNCGRELRHSRLWALRVSAELYSQEFADHVVLPLYNELKKFSNCSLTARILKHIHSNRHYWLRSLNGDTDTLTDTAKRFCLLAIKKQRLKSQLVYLDENCLLYPPDGKSVLRNLALQ
ncbi:cAMP-specific 3',5'-cyclic phosphodiesterase 7B [Trichinella nativa]|uniref:cAMP-specific 3',5'-cyclic phosphodiesterase 7B n=2 Tax=Trichinella TaxID=6333 RepID=A0A0V1LKR5_9BILA|nr:cAMP-specific 3',5'-cyclic phosphodiesterase 7B [Trichinella murrelli]KRX64109.1 cAMP-specific 3',5'-cyclic phosphodiesterase 7B [Trichinella sp. T9]KRZ59778.1 cAMP-specific 3',5'-cyclic phosphodiesterase 7B [Trichinella nativa]